VSVDEAIARGDPEPTLRPPTRVRVVDEVRQSIEEALLAGHVRPGERLVEQAISARLGVSRTTVREAFLMLERQGLVVQRPRHGTFVTRLSREDMRDLSRVRALLEGFAVSVGYAHIDSTAIDLLEEHVTAMQECTLPEGLPRLIALDLAFHRVLVESAASRRLTELWASLNGQVRALYLTSLEHRHASIDEIVRLHEGLLTVIRQGDAECIRRAVIEHYIGPGPEKAEAYNAMMQAMIESISPP